MKQKKHSHQRIKKLFFYYEQKKQIYYRKLVNQMYYKEELSQRIIVRQTGMSKQFVRKWTSSVDMDFNEDNRGWSKGRRRKWDGDVEDRIRLLRETLQEDPKEFYYGATAIENAWRHRYPQSTPPPLRTIGQIMSDLDLSEPRKNDRKKGASRYLCYPEHTVYGKLAKRVLEVDFIGEKYLTGETNPLHFIGFSFKKSPKLRYFQRVEAETSLCFIKACRHFFGKHEIPSAVKVDNCAATIGSFSGKRNVSKVMQFLLKREIIPIFAVPRKPFSQASIEGNNSVFARQFWRRRTFESIDEVDSQLKWFNKSSREYTGYQSPCINKKEDKSFKPQIYFIRQVSDHNEKGRYGCVNVLNETIKLPKCYIKYFVLACWDLNSECLKILFEKNQKAKIIERVPFKINTKNINI